MKTIELEYDYNNIYILIMQRVADEYKALAKFFKSKYYAEMRAMGKEIPEENLSTIVSEVEQVPSKQKQQESSRRQVNSSKDSFGVNSSKDSFRVNSSKDSFRVNSSKDSFGVKQQPKVDHDVKEIKVRPPRASSKSTFNIELVDDEKEQKESPEQAVQKKDKETKNKKK